MLAAGLKLGILLAMYIRTFSELRQLSYHCALKDVEESCVWQSSPQGSLWQT